MDGQKSLEFKRRQKINKFHKIARFKPNPFNKMEKQLASAKREQSPIHTKKRDGQEHLFYGRRIYFLVRTCRIDKGRLKGQILNIS